MINSARLIRLTKEGVWLVIGQCLMVIGSLIGVRLMTELLTADAYGELALGMTLTTLVNQTILGPLSGGISRFYAPAIEKNDFYSYLKAVKQLQLYATGIITLLIIFSVIGILIVGEINWLVIMLFAFIYSILSGYSGIISCIQVAARQRGIVAFHQGIEPFLRFFIAAILIIWLGATSTIALFGFVISALILYLSQAYFFQRFTKNKMNTIVQNNWLLEIWHFSWPISIFGIFTWFQIASDRWSLIIFNSTQDVGNFAVLYQLGYYPITLLSGMVMQFLLPILYQRSGDAKNKERNADVAVLSWKLTWFSLSLTAIAFIVAVMFHSQVFQIFVADKFRDISYLLPWLIASGGIFASGQALASNLHAQMKTREMIFAKIVTALIGILLNVIGANLFGLIGIIGAGVVFSALYFLWIMMIVIREGDK